MLKFACKDPRMEVLDKEPYNLHCMAGIMFVCIYLGMKTIVFLGQTGQCKHQDINLFLLYFHSIKLQV